MEHTLPSDMGYGMPFYTEESREYRQHVARECAGMERSITNDHPDGCFWCGSPHHFSTDCRERE